MSDETKEPASCLSNLENVGNRLNYQPFKRTHRVEGVGQLSAHPSPIQTKLLQPAKWTPLSNIIKKPSNDFSPLKCLSNSRESKPAGPDDSSQQTLGRLGDVGATYLHRNLEKSLG